MSSHMASIVGEALPALSGRWVMGPSTHIRGISV